MTVIPLPQAQPITTDVALTFGAHEIDDIDVFDSEIVSDTCERISIGGGGALFGRCWRVEANDLVEVADALHRLADRIVQATFAARQDRIEALQHDCICGTRLDPDEVTCGAARCDSYARAEAWADSHSERF